MTSTTACPRPEVEMIVEHRASPSSDRRGVVGLLVLLFAITYLDRVCISVAGPRMQEDLGIDPIGWGWVTGMFTLAYCLFEIPTGMVGDRSVATRPRRKICPGSGDQGLIVGVLSPPRPGECLLSSSSCISRPAARFSTSTRSRRGRTSNANSSQRARSRSVSSRWCQIGRAHV